jgi:hypothetical protein
MMAIFSRRSLPDMAAGSSIVFTATRVPFHMAAAERQDAMHVTVYMVVCKSYPWPLLCHPARCSAQPSVPSATVSNGRTAAITAHICG